ncbi:MAG: Na(+)/H(+) antiporter subunit D [Gammaproteobacteria bacterium]|nr:MAG: Na(+)/H(+) antiporter subunit D [Gammaproteobacteria bacterium]
MLTLLLSPFGLFLLAALVLPWLSATLRRLLLVGVPLLALLSLLLHGHGNHGQVAMLGFELEFLRIDGLSFIFALVFCIGAFIAGIHALHVDDRMQQIATLVYAGSAIAAVLAGDLVVLFLWWEGTALASVFLIWARRTDESYATGMRYLVIQVLSGVLLLAGLLVHYQQTGSISFDHLGLVNTGTVLIFIGFGIKVGFPLLHSWIPDAYPASTVTGTVVLSIFTTKMAVYALARGYAGTEILVWLGVLMALYPLYFAEVENDLRRVLAWSLNNQLGFMVVGVGIGTELAINGAAVHAVASVLYKGLLFMCIGAVLYRTGTAKASELGGLYRHMPVTAACCLVGAASIASMPLFSGFVSKSLIVSAAAYEHHDLAWYALIISSVGVMSHTAIKVPWFAFFGTDRHYRGDDAPAHMQIAMLIAAALCLGIGVFPGALHALLPHEVDYHAFTFAHLLTQMQLIVFALLGYAVLFRLGYRMEKKPGTLPDVDIVYRRWAPAALPVIAAKVIGVNRALRTAALSAIGNVQRFVEHVSRPGAVFARGWSVASMMFTVVVMMLIMLLGNFMG